MSPFLGMGPHRKLLKSGEVSRVGLDPTGLVFLQEEEDPRAPPPLPKAEEGPFEDTREDGGLPAKERPRGKQPCRHLTSDSQPPGDTRLVFRPLVWGALSQGELTKAHLCSVMAG